MPRSSTSHMPILYPGDVQEALDLGRHAVALSRACGCGSALKLVTAVADGTGTVDLAPRPRQRRSCRTSMVDGRSYVPAARPAAAHAVHPRHRARAPRGAPRRRPALRRDEPPQRASTSDASDAWIGIVATRPHLPRAAARRSACSGSTRRRRIARRRHPAAQARRCQCPLDRDVVRHFARGLDEILVVEEKNPTIETARQGRALRRGRPARASSASATTPARRSSRLTGELDADASPSCCAAPRRTPRRREPAPRSPVARGDGGAS